MTGLPAQVRVEEIRTELAAERSWREQAEQALLAQRERSERLEAALRSAELGLKDARYIPAAYAKVAEALSTVAEPPRGPKGPDNPDSLAAREERA